MNLLKGCLNKISQEESINWETVYGAIKLDNWRPFTYMIMLLDYCDIVEHNLAEAGVNMLIDATQFTLTEDPKFAFKVCKLPKFDEFNLNKFVWVLKNSLGDVHDAGGTAYEELITTISEAF